MLRQLQDAFEAAVFYVVLALKAVRFWDRGEPIANVETFIRFAETRSKYVSQTTLYGYIRTRAGTRYASLLEDPIFAESVNIAKWEVYLACLFDLTRYIVAKVGENSDATADELCKLTVHSINRTLNNEVIPEERPDGFSAAMTAFEERAKMTNWAELKANNTVFSSSADALVEWAPIADELKILDVEIVRNSILFKWKRVRDQLDPLIEAEALLQDWRHLEATSANE